MPQSRFLRFTAYVGGIMAIIAATSMAVNFVLNNNRQTAYQKEQLNLDEQWYDDDVAWNADIIERQRTIEELLGILVQRVDDGEKRFDDVVDEIEGIETQINDLAKDMADSLGRHEGMHLVK